MAKIVEEVEVRADASQANREVDKFERKMTKSVAAGAIAAQAATAAFRALVGEIKKGIGAALEFERTTLQLQTAIRVQGGDVDNLTDAFQRQASEIERLTGTSDEVIRRLQAQAISFGVLPGKVDEVVRAAISLANVMGRDVDPVFQQLLKTSTGLAEETIALVPGVKELTKEQLKSGEAIKLVNEQFGEFIDMNTRGDGAGLVTRLGTSWDNFAEAIGKTATNSKFMTAAMADINAALALSARFLEEGELGLAFASIFGAGGEGRAAMVAALAKEDAAARAADLAQQREQERQAGKDPSKVFDRSGRGRGGGPAIEFGAGFDANLMKGSEKAIKDRDEEERQLEEVLLARAVRELEISEQVEEMKREQRAQSNAIADEQFAALLESMHKQAEAQQALMTNLQNQYLNIATRAASMFQNMMLQAFENLVNGQEVSAVAMATSFVKSIGRQLLALSVQHGSEAAAAFIRKDFATGGQFLALAGAEQAAGTAMFATGTIIGASQNNPNGIAGFGGGGGGRVSGFVSNQEFFASQAATQGNQGFGSQASSAAGGITIKVEGAQSLPEAGAAYQQAIDEARAEGRI